MIGYECKGHRYYLRSDNEILEEFDYVGTAVLYGWLYVLQDYRGDIHAQWLVLN